MPQRLKFVFSSNDVSTSDFLMEKFSNKKPMLGILTEKPPKGWIVCKFDREKALKKFKLVPSQNLNVITLYIN